MHWQADSWPSEPPGKPKNTGVGSLSLPQGIFPTQESNQGLLHCRQILHQLSYQGNPQFLLNNNKIIQAPWKQNLESYYFSMSQTVGHDWATELTDWLTFLYGTHPLLYIFEVSEKILICSFCLSLTSANLLQGKAYSWRVSVEFYPLTQSYMTEFSLLTFFFLKQLYWAITHYHKLQFNVFSIFIDMCSYHHIQF